LSSTTTFPKFCQASKDPGPGCRLVKRPAYPCYPERGGAAPTTGEGAYWQVYNVRGYDEMKQSQLNLCTALLSLLGSLAWFAAGQVVTGLIWFACSLVWVTLALFRLRSSITEPHPGARVAHRLSRLLFWS
jgi:hypothetical protein